MKQHFLQTMLIHFLRSRYTYVIIGYNTAMVCQGPVLAHLRQYWPEDFSPRANASEGVPKRARGIPQPCCNIFITYIRRIQILSNCKLKREMINTFRKQSQSLVYVSFSLDSYTRQMTSHVMTSFKDLFTNKLMRR